MQAQLQRVERQRVADRDDQLAVEQELLRLQLPRASRRLRGNSAPSGLPDLDVSVTSSPSRRARQRKPSHLGSNCQPSPSGSSAASNASIGAGRRWPSPLARQSPAACSRSRCARGARRYAAGRTGGDMEWHSIRTPRPRAISTAWGRPRCRKRTIIPSARNGCCCGRLLVAAVVTWLIVRSGILDRIEAKIGERRRNLRAFVVSARLLHRFDGPDAAVDASTPTGGARSATAAPASRSRDWLGQLGTRDAIVAVAHGACS